MKLREKSIIAMAVVVVMLALGAALTGGPQWSNDARESIALPINDHTRSQFRRDEVIFREDFENNAEGWSTSDLTNTQTAFHKSDFLSADNNLLWWAGDTITDYQNDYYGYGNIWLQYLDTPVLNLSNASDAVTLEFDAYWLLEDPRRVPPPEGWDGWDGWLVLVSSDEGQSFEVQQPQSPSYTAQHLSAAERFWMLQGNWPGWVFESKRGGRQAWDDSTDVSPEPEWVHCVFTLRDYRAERIVVRFMLVTDRTVSSIFSGAGEGNEYLANGGVLIDNIEISDDNDVFLQNNADDDPVPSDLIPRRGHGFGDTWSLTRTSVHTGAYAMWNDDDNFNVTNALDSPPFEVPEGFNTHFEYWARCDLPDSYHRNDPAPQPLKDFYQIYVSADEGATWNYQLREYQRPETGDGEWFEYVPGVPLAGDNVDLTLNGFNGINYAGETIRIRWLFMTDNDHREGNGAGVFLDDIQVISENRMNRDAGFENLYIPYPTTVRYRLRGLTADLVNFGLNDLNQMWCYWGWGNEDIRKESRILPYPSLDAGERETQNLTDYIVRPVPGWTPSNPGVFVVYARTAIGAQTPQDNSDDDQNRSNDSTAVTGVRVYPEGLFELGYDHRSIQFRQDFDRGFGAAARFSPDDVEIGAYSIAFVHFFFNGRQEGSADFRLHFLRAGQDITTPGAEIRSLDVTVPSDSCLPNGMTIHVENEESLHQLNGDFWVWAEIRRDDGRPEVTYDELISGQNRYFSYNGQQAASLDGDYLIHAAVVPAANTAPNLAGSEDLFDFGNVPPHESTARFFELYSVGLNEVVITDVRVNENSFEVDWPGEVTLRTGQSVRFAIIFTPPDLEVHAGELIIESTDDSPPLITVAGSGGYASVKDDITAPAEFGLRQPYPNPFNSVARIEYRLSRPGEVRLALYDHSGRRVALLAEGFKEAGTWPAIVKAGDLPSGVYLLRLEGREGSSTRKLALIR